MNDVFSDKHTRTHMSYTHTQGVSLMITILSTIMEYIRSYAGWLYPLGTIVTEDKRNAYTTVQTLYNHAANMAPGDFIQYSVK